MKTDAEKLFELMTCMFVKGKTTKDISAAVRNDPILISISNSYCVQCGECCDEKYVDGVCKNKEAKDDGLTYCLLHSDSESYPDGKKIPDLKHAVANRLNPNKWAKPLDCYHYGPHLAILSFLVAEEDEDHELIDCLTNPCEKQILSDYKAWRETNC